MNSLVTGPGSGLYQPADLAPGLGAGGDVGADRLIWEAEPATEERARERRRRIPTVQTSGVAENDDADLVLGSQNDRGVKAGHDAGLPDRLAAALLAELQRKPHARQPRVKLEVGLKHRRQGLGLTT